MTNLRELVYDVYDDITKQIIFGWDKHNIPMEEWHEKLDSLELEPVESTSTEAVRDKDANLSLLDMVRMAEALNCKLEVKYVPKEND